MELTKHIKEHEALGFPTFNPDLSGYVPYVGANQSIIPLNDSAIDLGSSTKYFANGYFDRLYLNSTAYLDGITAGTSAFTGKITVDNLVSGVNSVSTIGQTITQGGTFISTDGLGVGRLVTSGNSRGILGSVQYSGAVTTNGVIQGINAFVTNDITTTGSMTTSANGGSMRNRYSIQNTGAVAVTQASAVSGVITQGNTAIVPKGGSIVDAAVFHAEAINIIEGSITNGYGLWVRGGALTGGTLVNRYGIYIDDLVSGSTLRYGIYQAGATDPNYFAGKIGIGIIPTAKLHLGAGSATAGTAPLKFTSGAITTVAEDGTIEYLNNRFRIRGNDTLWMQPTNATNPGLQVNRNSPSSSNVSGVIFNQTVADGNGLSVSNTLNTGDGIAGSFVNNLANGNFVLGEFQGLNAGQFNVFAGSGNFGTLFYGLRMYAVGGFFAGLYAQKFVGLRMKTMETISADVFASEAVMNYYCLNDESYGSGIVPNFFGTYIEKPTRATRNYQQYLLGTGAGTGTVYGGDLDFANLIISGGDYDFTTVTNWTGTNWKQYGGVGAVTVNAGGSGYTVGDVLTIVQTGASGGTVTVATLGAGNSVATVNITTAGTLYNYPATALTTTGGTGTGAKFDITSLAGGYLIHTAGSTTDATLLNANLTASSIKNTRDYTVIAQISGWTTGDITFKIGTASGRLMDFATYGVMSSVFSGIITANADNANLLITPTSDFNGKITGIKIVATEAWNHSRVFQSASSTLDLATDLNGVETSFGQVVSDGIKFGGVAGANYSKFEADGTLVFNGNATVWNDMYIDIAPKTTGTGKPTLATFSGNINKYTFAVNDMSELGTNELLHDWKEGTPIEVHVHWATNGLNDATVRGVKWEIDYTWANMQSAGGTIVFGAATTVSAETSIAANEPDKTHKYTSVVVFTPTGGKIGGSLLMSLKRIASVTNTAPANNPWCLMVGVHYEKDTCGSRSTSTK